MKKTHNHWLLTGVSICALFMSSCKSEPPRRLLDDIHPGKRTPPILDNKELQDIYIEKIDSFRLAEYNWLYRVFGGHETASEEIDWFDPNVDSKSAKSISVTKQYVDFPPEGGTTIIKKMNPGNWTIADLMKDDEEPVVDHTRTKQQEDGERCRTYSVWRRYRIDKYFFSIEITNDPNQMRISVGPNDEKRERKLTITVANRWHTLKHIYVTQAPMKTIHL